VVPTALAFVEHYWTIVRRGDWEWRHPIRSFATYDPVPTVWDYVSQQLEPCFVRVLTPEGRWVGGWLGDPSFISSFPEPRELFIAVQWRMDDSGSFVEQVAGSSGVWVRCDDARAVELIAAPEQGADLEGADGKEEGGPDAVAAS